MSPLTFLLAWAGLVAGTYLLRVVGVKFGAAFATRESSAEPGTEPSAQDRPGAAWATVWLDRATVVLIAAVAATSAIFDGKHLADPALIAGVGAGVVAAIIRVPMLVCVIIGMAVCAGLRVSGLL